jgi:hypothetical protein
MSVTGSYEQNKISKQCSTGALEIKTGPHSGQQNKNFETDVHSTSRNQNEVIIWQHVKKSKQL